MKLMALQILLVKFRKYTNLSWTKFKSFRIFDVIQNYVPKNISSKTFSSKILSKNKSHSDKSKSSESKSKSSSSSSSTLHKKAQAELLLL